MLIFSGFADEAGEDLEAQIRATKQLGCRFIRGMAFNYHREMTLKRLCEHLHSEHFRVVFDTGNSVGLPNCMGEPPYSPQSSFECYQMLKPYTAYIHIKDQLAGNTWPPVRTMPGEGDGEVVRIIQDLVDTGYSGYVAIEPQRGLLSRRRSTGRLFRYILCRSS